jgi:hypothetical protein
MAIYTFKYHVSFTDGKISVRIKLELPYSPPSNSIVVFLSCRPFVVITTFSNKTIEWDDGEKGNSNLMMAI